MHAPHAHVLDTHETYAFVTARLGGQHICVSTKTAIDAILRVQARERDLDLKQPRSVSTRATCTCSRHTSKVCSWHYTLEREALVVCKVYMWVVTVCASARVPREPLRGPRVHGLKGAAFRSAVALNEIKALCRETTRTTMLGQSTDSTLPLGFPFCLA